MPAVDGDVDAVPEEVAARRAEGIPFALLGDFNRTMTNPNDELWRSLTATTPLLRATEGTSNPCWASGRGGRHLDPAEPDERRLAAAQA